MIKRNRIPSRLTPGSRTVNDAMKPISPAAPRRIGHATASALLSLSLLAWGNGPDTETNSSPCSEEWFRYVESQLGTGDGAGHGPDVGSAEWKSVVEFKLGIRDDPQVPNVASDTWCDYIDALLESNVN